MHFLQEEIYTIINMEVKQCYIVLMMILTKKTSKRIMKLNFSFRWVKTIFYGKSKLKYHYTYKEKLYLK